MDLALQCLDLAAIRAGRRTGGVIRRGHQVQLAVLRGRGSGSLRALTTTPRGVLPTNLGCSRRRRNRRNSAAIRHTQDRAGAQDVHVLLEGTRIGLENGQHPTVRLGAVLSRASGSRRNGRKRFTALHGMGRATRVRTLIRRRGRGSGLRGMRMTLMTRIRSSTRGRRISTRRRRLTSTRSRSRCGGSRRGRSGCITGACNRTLMRAGTGSRSGHRSVARRGLPGGIDRGIEQHGVLTHQMPARPVHLNKEGNERLGNRVRGLQRDIGLAVARAHGFDLHTAQEYRPIEPVSRECVTRCNLRLESL